MNGSMLLYLFHGDIQALALNIFHHLVHILFLVMANLGIKLFKVRICLIKAQTDNMELMVLIGHSHFHTVYEINPQLFSLVCCFPISRNGFVVGEGHCLQALLLGQIYYISWGVCTV